jgi:hypothetical protein
MAADRDQAGRRGALTACALLLAFLAGCGGGATGKGSRMGAGDPLAGPVKPVATAGVSIGAPTGGVPPVPAPSGPTTTAGLATGTVPSFNAGRPGPSAPPSGWREPGAPKLGAPVPPTRGSAAPSIPSPSGPVVLAGGGGGVQTIDQGVKALELRGARGFRLELQRETGQWRCSCSVPNRQNPASRQTYDTTAADPLSAVRAVVERVERDNPS